jgi:hypothetical protein
MSSTLSHDRLSRIEPVLAYNSLQYNMLELLLTFCAFGHGPCSISLRPAMSRARGM